MDTFILKSWDKIFKFCRCWFCFSLFFSFSTHQTKSAGLFGVIIGLKSWLQFGVDDLRARSATTSNLYWSI